MLYLPDEIVTATKINFDLDDHEIEARIDAVRAEAKAYRAKCAANRKVAREYPPLREGLILWLNQGWTTIASAADYLRHYAPAGTSSPYSFLSNPDQVTVVRSLLEALHKEKVVERAWGKGERKGEVEIYIAFSALKPNPNE